MAEPKAQEVNLDVLVENVAKSVATATAQAIAENDAKNRIVQNDKPIQKSVYNPTGGPKKPLARRTIFCGAEQNAKFLKPEEIELFNKIKPGRYNGRRWEVIEQVLDNNETTIEVRIPVREVQDRMELAQTAPSLVAILKLIIAEQGDK